MNNKLAQSLHPLERKLLLEFKLVNATEISVDDLMNKPFSKALDELKIRLLRKALKEARYNQRRAARKLGLTYHQFRGVYRKYRGKMK